MAASDSRHPFAAMGRHGSCVGCAVRTVYRDGHGASAGELG